MCTTNTSEHFTDISVSLVDQSLTFGGVTDHHAASSATIPVINNTSSSMEYLGVYKNVYVTYECLNISRLSKLSY